MTELLPDATILAAIRRVERWLIEHRWRGYEPHDGLATAFRPLLGSNRMTQLITKQVVMRSPWNIRPLLGIAPGRSPEGMGFLARGYVRLAKVTGTERDRRRAYQLLGWLADHTEPGYGGASWGNQFDYATRFFYEPAGTPIIVWTAHNAQAFLDAYELWQEPRFLAVAESAATFVQESLTRHDKDGTYFSYVPIGDYPIHNANLLGAALLARVAAITKDDAKQQLARKAVAYSVQFQRPDGSWWYGESPGLQWVDNFHTGYNLESLLGYAESSGDDSFQFNTSRGLDHYVRTCFLPDGTPRYYPGRTYPIDIQCAAQSIETLNLFSRQRPQLREQAEKVARWTLDNMQDADGSFYFRRGKRWTARVRMFHWGQGTMLCALAGLLAAPTDAAAAPAAKQVTA